MDIKQKMTDPDISDVISKTLEKVPLLRGIIVIGVHHDDYLDIDTAGLSYNAVYMALWEANKLIDDCRRSNEIKGEL